MITDGARDLRAYLDRVGLSVPKFCEANKLERISVQRALNGERRRISVDFAWDIQVATGGEVQWDRWHSSTARAPKGREHRPRSTPRQGSASHRQTRRT